MKASKRLQKLMSEAASLNHLITVEEVFGRRDLLRYEHLLDEIHRAGYRPVKVLSFQNIGKGDDSDT